MKTITLQPGTCIDAYLKQNREPNTVFELDRGVYYTSGGFGFEDFDVCMLAPGCSIRGAGSIHTRIELMSPILKNKGQDTNYVEAFTGGANTSGSSGYLSVRGFQLHMAGCQVPTVAMHLWSSGVEVADVHCADVWGSRSWKTYPKEGFGILVNNAHDDNGAPEGGCSVVDCNVSMRGNPEENYSTGIYMGMVQSGHRPLRESLVAHSEVYGLDYHCAFAFNDDTHLHNCRATGARRAIFSDTGPIRRSRVTNLVARDVCWAMDLRSQGEAQARRGVTIRNSEFHFASMGGWCQGILLVDESKDQTGVIEGVIVQDCHFHRSLIGQASAGRSSGKRVQGVTHKNNIWVGSWLNPEIQQGAGKWIQAP